MTVKAILFDLDDTLLWDERSVDEAFHATCTQAANYYIIHPKQLEDAVRREACALYETLVTFHFTKMIDITPFEALWANFTEGENLNFKHLRRLAPYYRRESWTRGLKAVGINDSKLGSVLGEIFAAERRARSIVFEETFKILDELSGKYKLLLLTNGSPDLQKEKIAGVPQLASYFDHIVISGTFGVGKPDTAIFEYAMDLLQITANEGIMVGNNLTTDILGSHRIGMKNVWINRHGASRTDGIVPDCEISNLEEIHNILQGNLESNVTPIEAETIPLVWHSPMRQPFHIAGFSWLEQEGVYRRLPLNPKYPLPPDVDDLANCTAGGQIRFQTNSSRLSLKVRLTGIANMNHMPATGQCGFDCYIGLPEELMYYNTTKYDHMKKEYEFAMFEKLEAGLRNITLYFPLYIGVEEVVIGLDPEADIMAPPPYLSDKRIVIYGTSITQGGCAARPGMAYTNILSRKIPVEFINLGFSGSGRGEADVARIISEIPNLALFVLDYEANCVSPELFQITLPEFIRIIRSKHPEVPIVVLSQIRFARELFDRELLELRSKRKSIQMEAVNAIREQGDESIYFHDGEHLLGADFNECTVDGVHPTDLGFIRMAEQLAPVLKKYIL
jgi:HAD superfamily hydrolase (TIGR01549 family)